MLSFEERMRRYQEEKKEKEEKKKKKIEMAKIRARKEYTRKRTLRQRKKRREMAKADSREEYKRKRYLDQWNELKRWRQRKYDERDRKLKEAGDEYGSFYVVIVKNEKEYRKIAHVQYKLEAESIYEKNLQENRATSTFPITTEREGIDVHFEILLFKRISNDNEEEKTVYVRDKDGKFVANTFSRYGGSAAYTLLKKSDWFEEEYFYVYGFHPLRDRKSYNFILDELVLQNSDSISATKRIMAFNRCIVIHYDTDFDLVVCANETEAEQLYNKLEKDVTALKKRYILFMGEIDGKTQVKWIRQEIIDKTGWSEKFIDKISKPSFRWR